VTNKRSVASISIANVRIVIKLKLPGSDCPSVPLGFKVCRKGDR